MFTPFTNLASKVFVLSVVSLFTFGCAVHKKGLIENAGETIYFVEQGNKRTAVVGPALNLGLGRLDGHLVELWGKKGLRALNITGYRVLEGPHGLALWVGRVVTKEGRVGIIDIEGSQFRPIVGPKESSLKGKYGCLVLLEGYIEGAGQVRVVYYRILAEAED